MSIDMAANPTKTTARPSVTYTEYVKDFTRLTAYYLFIAFGGIALIAGAVMYLKGPLMVMFIALGLGSSGAGLGGVLTALSAHSAYTRYLGLITATTYQSEPAPAKLRAFVPSANGEATIRAGRFSLTKKEWAALYASAGREGKLTRDKATKALPRELYRDWGATLGDFYRLGIVDEGGIITPFGWQFYQDNIGNPPTPQATNGAGGEARTHARRTHGPHGEG